MEKPSTTEPGVHPALADPILGTYLGEVGGVECRLELKHETPGIVRGRFCAEGEALEVRGDMHGGTIYGVLLEPRAGSPVAVFRAALREGGLTLEVDVPEAGREMNFSEAGRFQLAWVSPSSLPDHWRTE